MVLYDISGVDYTVGHPPNFRLTPPSSTVKQFWRLYSIVIIQWTHLLAGTL